MTPEHQVIAMPLLRENFSTRSFAQMNGFGPPLVVAFFYIKSDNEKTMNGGDKSPTCLSNEGPSHSKTSCTIPRTM